jgi:hypothetical protein
MKSVEAVKRKHSLWPIEGGREPASTQELGVIGDDAICPTITEIDR